MFKVAFSTLLFFIPFTFTNGYSQRKGDSNNTGNVFVPGYFADPRVLYDAQRDSFYIYSTTVGVWIGYSVKPHVAVSKDLVDWRRRIRT